MLSAIPMASNIFFSIASSIAMPFADAVLGLRNDFQQGHDLAREPRLVLSPDSNTFSDTKTPLTTDWIENNHVGNKASEGTRGTGRSSPQEGRDSLKDPKSIEVLLKTVGSFARVDIQMLGIYLQEFNDDNVSEESRRQTARSAQRIQEMLREASHQNSLSDAKAMAIAHKAGEETRDASQHVLRNEIGPLSASDLSSNNLIESRLHAGEFLTQSIRHSLLVMLTALDLQLDCCDENHFMRLKLTGFVDSVHRKSRPFFDLYLSTGHDCMRSYWVESKCTFIRELTQGEKKGCTFIQNSIRDKKKLSLFLKEAHNTDPETQNITTMESPQENLCPIQLDVSEESKSSATPIVSLASLLEQHKSRERIRRVSNAEAFQRKERDWLCLNLALSLLHMPGQNWDRAVWYSEHLDEELGDLGIFFLRDPSTQKIVDKTRPYLSWRLQKEPRVQGSTKELQVQEPSKGSPYDTQLLGFASLLIEIHEWKRLDLKPKSKPEDLGFYILKYINEILRPSDFEFASALKACLNYAGSIEATAQDKPERIQAYCFEYIVKPLHRYLGNPLLSELPSTAIILSDQATPDGSDEPETVLSNYDSSYSYDESQKQDSYEKRFWLEMKKFTEKYISPLQKSTLPSRGNPGLRKKVRIAVIDSGVQAEDTEIMAAEITGRIRGYRNFTSASLNDCEDEVGHGTKIARLLLTVAPEAELYIAKVSTQERIPKNQLYRIAEAIKWAVMHWEVDIISISLALSEEHYDINEELNEALSPSGWNAKSKLIFAAAGNWGVYKEQAWPAKKTGVIAVHATDGSGQAAKFNSTSESDLKIATLGENIKMRLSDPDNPSVLKDVYISGSSFATPIVAGIAANVLEFSRHKLKLNQARKDLLYSHQAMTQILKAMSSRIGRYDFVHPLAFWEGTIHGDWKGQKLLPNDPQNICKVLNSILEGRSKVSG